MKQQRISAPATPLASAFFALVFFACLPLLATAGASAAIAASASDSASAAVRLDGPNPVSKVLELIADLKAKVIQDAEEAQKVYEEFAGMCEDQSREFHYEIKTTKQQVEELKAVIEKADAQIGTMSSKIDKLSSDISVDEADLKTATDLRKQERSDFEIADKELVGTVDMLARATAIIERNAAKLQAGGKDGSDDGGGSGDDATLVQVGAKDGQSTGTATGLVGADGVVKMLASMVEASSLGSASAERLQALLQTTQTDDEELDDSNVGAPDAQAYEGHTDTLMNTLDDLAEKAQKQLADARKVETSKQHNYDMVSQALRDRIRLAEKELDSAKSKKSDANEKKASADGDLTMAKKSLAHDTEALRKLHRDCISRATEFEDETKIRGEEVEALSKATKVISETSAPAAKITYSDGGDEASASFLQVSRTKRVQSSMPTVQALRAIRQLAHKHNSAAISQLATRMDTVMRSGAKSQDDVFAKVKSLISNMIRQLENEAAEEADHKAFCDKEMSDTKENQEDKAADVEKLTTQIDIATAQISKLKSQVGSIQKEIGKLVELQAKMTKIRQEENALFKKTKADLDAGIQGVRMALKVLRKFYARDDASDSPSQGAAGIIGLLEVAEADFSRGLSACEKAEDEAVVKYEAETQGNAVRKAEKEVAIKHKTKEVNSLDNAVAQTSTDRTDSQAQLDAVNEYLSKLTDQCVAKAEPYEERKKHREEEIAGLQEALNRLGGEAVLIQDTALRRKPTLRGVQRHA